jgi:hypothetical protein
MISSNLLDIDNKYLLINRLYENLPRKPYCTNDFFGLQIREKKYAISHSHIQFNHPSFKRYIVIDADYAGAATAWKYDFPENIPVPNLIVTNPENSHCHFYYELSAPVSFTESSSIKAQNFYTAVNKKLTEVLRGDTKYTGLIAKNPAHEKWIVEAPRVESYSLHELVEHLELHPSEYRALPGKKSFEAIDVSNGRNDMLFNSIRVKAYVHIRDFRSKTYAEWEDHVRNMIQEKNLEFNEPLPYSEVKATAKSIAKYCWKKDGYCYQEFCERQINKAKKGGRVRSDKYIELRKKAIALLKRGKNKKFIANVLAVSYRSVLRWLYNIKLAAAIMHLSELKNLCDNAQNQILAAFVASLIVLMLDDMIYNFNKDDVLTVHVTFNLKLLI